MESSGGPLGLFSSGLRFDLSLVGIVCFVPVVLGSLLAMFDATRAIAKGLILVWLVLGLALVLVAELVTPYFLANEAVRPDADALGNLPALVPDLVALAVRHPVPAALGVLLVLLILVAYLARVESARFLHYRVSRPSALALAVFGGLLCLVAARSSFDPFAPPLSPADVALGGEAVVDQIAMNSAWTTLHSLTMPWLQGVAVPRSAP